MTTEEIRNRIPEREISFLTSRSSGPGGQNVNKVNTKVEARFNIYGSTCLSDAEKEVISQKLKSRINENGELVARSQSERSQLRNKQKALEKIYLLLARALTEIKVRKPTTPSISSVESRLEKKRLRGKIKKLRLNDGYDGAPT